MQTVLRGLLLAGVFGCLTPTLDARPIFVDNQNGWDGNDGMAPENETPLTGPVRSLRRATELARRGDAIVLRNTGQPYYETLALSGGRLSGFETEPFRIIGNGAVLSGIGVVSSDGWERQRDGLYRLSLTRKGYYRFFRDGEPIPEQVFPSNTWTADDLAVDHWASRQGAVFFRFDGQRTPVAENWTYAALEQGLSLVQVRNVQIFDLTIVGFRVDGVNVDSGCRQILLENVTIERNGRAGLAVGGDSQVLLRTSRISDNGRHSVLITERAGLQLDECDLDGVEPTVAP